MIGRRGKQKEREGWWFRSFLQIRVTDRWCRLSNITTTILSQLLVLLIQFFTFLGISYQRPSSISVNFTINKHFERSKSRSFWINEDNNFYCLFLEEILLVMMFINTLRITIPEKLKNERTSNEVSCSDNSFSLIHI